MGPIRLRRRRRGGACWPFAHEAAPILGQIDHHAGQGTYRWHLARSTRRARMMISQAHADCSGRRRDRYAGQLRERAPFRSLFGRASLSKKALRHASLSKKALACLHGRHGRSRLEQRPSRPTRCLGKANGDFAESISQALGYPVRIRRPVSGRRLSLRGLGLPSDFRPSPRSG